MKRRLALALTALAVFGAASSVATNASAHPNYASSCPSHHGRQHATQDTLPHAAVLPIPCLPRN